MAAVLLAISTVGVLKTISETFCCDKNHIVREWTGFVSMFENEMEKLIGTQPICSQLWGGLSGVTCQRWTPAPQCLRLWLLWQTRGQELTRGHWEPCLLVREIDYFGLGWKNSGGYSELLREDQAQWQVSSLGTDVPTQVLSQHWQVLNNEFQVLNKSTNSLPSLMPE